MVVPDTRWVSFMYSYPNLIPLPTHEVRRIAATTAPFAFDRIRRTPNTRDAHRLIRYAASEGRADAVVEALFRAYFTEGRNVGERAVLAEVGGESGLDADAVQEWLDSPAEVDQVLAEDRGARRLGINAVPCFIFERNYAISGAQEPEFFLPVFDLVQNGGEMVE